MDFSNLLKATNGDLLGVTDEELQSLTEPEKKVLLDTVQELLDNGSSNTLKSLWYEDYEEIPVDIETFINDPDYLGESFGGSLYPFWQDVLKTLFAPGAKYYECILSGAIGIGKTTVADIGLAYMLHRLLCLKNPQKYYGLSGSSIMTINFFNVTKELGSGVSYAKLQSMLMNSPWFLDHGEIVGTQNETYVPGKNIQINVGSQVEHALGQDVFCVDGDTTILTERGAMKIRDLEWEDVSVYQVDNEGNLYLGEDKAEIALTAYTDELIEIELEDGGIIRCTDSHRFMLKDGTYKRACELTVDDELADLENKVNLFDELLFDLEAMLHVKDRYSLDGYTYEDYIGRRNYDAALVARYIKETYGLEKLQPVYEDLREYFDKRNLHVFVLALDILYDRDRYFDYIKSQVERVIERI